MPPAKRARTADRRAGAADAAADDELRRVGADRLQQGQWQGAALNVMRVTLDRRAFFLLLMLLLAAAAGAIEMLEGSDRAPDRMRRRIDMADHLNSMTDAECARYYRVPSTEVFHRLVGLARPPPAVEARARRSARLSTGGFVDYDIRVSMTLRFLAGGSYLDIMYLHGVARSTVYKHVYRTAKTLEAKLPEFTLDEDINDPARCRELSRVFEAKTDGHIKGAIAALDGIIFKVEKPSQLNKDKCPNPNKFHCHKGYPGVSVQAACDGHRRFTAMAMNHAASVHDSRAWRRMMTRGGALLHQVVARSEAMAAVDSEHHPFGFFILGDDAYPCREDNRLVTPWTNVRNKPYRDAFNYHQSRGRINIECAFGMLTKKFLLFSRPMCMDIPKCRLLVRLAMKLHNLCIDERLGEAGAVVPTDFTGGYETRWAAEKAARIEARRTSRGEVYEPRQAADLALHLTSGTRVPNHLSASQPSTDESPLTAWENDPHDLVPNRTDLEAGPRAGLTDLLAERCVFRPDPREAARRVDAARFGSA